jgi:hypothetical protein
VRGSAETSRKARDQDQFLAVGRRRPGEIAVLRLDGEAAELEQVMQLSAIGPAKGHLARVFSEHRAIGSDLHIPPEITANLVEVVEIGPDNLARLEPGLRMNAVFISGLLVEVALRTLRWYVRKNLHYRDPDIASLSIYKATSGKVLYRLPVRLANPLTTAGAINGTGHSPTPVGGAVVGTIWTSTSAGASMMYGGMKPSKFRCSTTPSLRVIAPCSWERPKTRPP